jgi:hypothetical protein
LEGIVFDEVAIFRDEHPFDVVRVREQHAPPVPGAKVGGVAVLAEALLEKTEHVAAEARQHTHKPMAAGTGELADRSHGKPGPGGRKIDAYYEPATACVLQPGDKSSGVKRVRMLQRIGKYLARDAPRDYAGGRGGQPQSW